MTRGLFEVGGQTLGFCKVPRDHIDCNRRYKNKIELRMPTQCVFCPGLVGSSAIFLNSHSCECSLTCPTVKANCSHKQKSFYIQMEPLPLSTSTLSAQPRLSRSFICSPVFVLLHIYHYCGK